ncbi:CDP-alcohol phosphatidyltransferase family protein [Roseobacter sp. CCS2]|uniref:CDP-alcohol phosphatidyltransferase family protein n=1 Tax=Roseobacter sp. CCS2 TaxID=391593 RepID=UPI0000F3E4E2|nr:CDP-alcohol phosphatidyltransferase family protein [Roseobacter sp. CCS2]EBA11968.1 CDP-alcohol phosphatidyltransferase [Roseobacter sp. CCS2]
MRHPTSDKPITDRHAKPKGFGASPLHVFCGAALLGAGTLVFLYDLLFGMTAETTYFVVIGTGLYVLAATVAAFRLSQDFPHQSLGLCNLATLGRLVLVGVLCIVVMAGIAPNWATFGIAALALGLDGIDGWLARKQGLSSDFGAQFDVEVDAIFALVLAIYAATNGAAGPYVILLGLPHYLFWIARLQLPWLNRPLRPSFARKAVCVFQIGALIALQVPFLADGRLDLIIAAVTLALIWSFGRDILWLWQKREVRL